MLTYNFKVMKLTKKINIVASMFFILMVTALSACKDALDTAPFNAASVAKFYVDEESAKQVLIGVYRGVGGVNGWGFTTYLGSFWMDLASDNAVNVLGLNTDYCNIVNGALAPNNQIITNFWAGGYNKIMLANDFLFNLEKMSLAEISDVAKKRLRAEGRFLRAIEYFYLNQFYGSVPLVTKLLSAQEANSVSKATNEQLQEFITTELLAASADLPSFAAITGADRGRASRQAALAYLGRLKLSQEKYDEAATIYKTIIDAGENQIANNYETIFTTDKFSTENIYSLQFISGASFPANSTPLPGNCLPAINGGQVGINPTEDLATSYDFTDGTPFSYSDARYNPANLAANRDPRFAFSILSNGAVLGGRQYISNPDAIASVDRVTAAGVLQATKTGYCMRKYLPADGVLVNNYGGNIPLIRYSEVLLSYLEAMLEGSGAIDQTLLNNTINRVRGRTGVNMPAITTTDKALLRPILRKERRVELALEGVRLWDLKRWKLLPSLLNKVAWGAPFPNAISNLNNLQNLPNPQKLWYVGKWNFQPGQEVWPIPEMEQAINPNLR